MIAALAGAAIAIALLAWLTWTGQHEEADKPGGCGRDSAAGMRLSEGRHDDGKP